LVEAHDLVGETGKCKVGLSKGRQKDDGTFYADKNDIKEYLKAEVEAEDVTKTDSLDWKKGDAPF